MHLTAAADDHRAAALPPRMRFIIHHRRTCEKYAMTGLNSRATLEIQMDGMTARRLCSLRQAALLQVEAPDGVR